MPTRIEKDALTGKTTTGHEWDGIKELNTPLPKWWLYVLYATIAWSACGGCCIRAGRGSRLLRRHHRRQPADRAGRAHRRHRSARAQYLERIGSASLDQIAQDRSSPTSRWSARRRVRRQLCAVPRSRRRRPGLLPKSRRRRLDLGRHPRRHPHHDPLRRPQRSRADAVQRDARVRRARHAEPKRDQRRRRARARSPAAPRIPKPRRAVPRSPRNAPHATASRARACPSWAARRSPTPSGIRRHQGGDRRPDPRPPPWRHAGLGRAARAPDHQDPGRLRPLLGWRPVSRRGGWPDTAAR